VRLIRAAVAMTFLSAICIGFSFQISFRSYLKEQRLRQLEQGGHQSLPLPVLSMKSPVDEEDTVRL
jgi:hypothetical protein